MEENQDDMPDLEDASPDEPPQRVDFDKLMHPERNRFNHSKKLYGVLEVDEHGRMEVFVGFTHAPEDFCGLDEGACKHGGEGMTFHHTQEGWFVHTGCGYPTRRWWDEYWSTIVTEEP